MIELLHFRFSPLASILLSSILLASCVDDRYDLDQDIDTTIKVEGEITAPLFHSSANIETLLDELLSEENAEYLKTEDNALYLSYGGTMQISGDDLGIETGISLSGANASGVIPSGTIEPSLGLQTPEQTFHVQATPPDNIIKLEKFKIRSGIIRPTFSFSGLTLGAGDKIQARVTLPEAFQRPNDQQGSSDGIEELESNTLIITPESGPIYLTGMTVTCTYDRLSGTVLAWDLDYTIVITSQNGLTIPSGAGFRLALDFENIVMGDTYGQFDVSYLPSGPEEMTLDFMNDLFSEGDRLEIGDVNLKLETTTNIAIPVSLKIDKIEAYKNQELAATASSPEGFILSIDRMPATPGQSTSSSLVLDMSDGIGDLINAIPDRLKLHYTAGTDQDKYTPTEGAFFIPENPSMKFDYDVKIPLMFNDLLIGRESLIRDVFTESVRDAIPDDGTGQARLRLFVKNGLPLRLNLDVEIMDENEQVLITYTDKNIEEAQIDDQGRVTAPKTGVIALDIDNEDLLLIKERGVHVNLIYSLGSGEGKKAHLSLSNALEIFADISLKGGITL